MLQNVCI